MSNKKKVRVLKEFRLSEISIVDKPAQEGAKIVLLKRATTELGQPSAPQGDAVAKKNEETTGSAGGGQPKEKSMSNPDTTAATPDAVAKLDALQAELTIAKALGALSDMEKRHYAGLNDADKASFLKQDEGARRRTVEAAQAADAVIYTSDDGQTFRKSDDARLVAMAKRADAAERLAKVEREAREGDALAKRAEAELSKLPGLVSSKVALLKAVAGISDEKARTEIAALLKAANEALAKGFDRFGISGQASNESDPEAKLEALAKKYATDNKVSIVEARDRVLDTPEGADLVLEMRSN